MCSNWLGLIKFTLEKLDSDFWIINDYLYELLEDRGGSRGLEKGKKGGLMEWQTNQSNFDSWKDPAIKFRLNLLPMPI